MDRALNIHTDKKKKYEGGEDTMEHKSILERLFKFKRLHSKFIFSSFTLISIPVEMIKYVPDM